MYPGAPELDKIWGNYLQNRKVSCFLIFVCRV